MADRVGQRRVLIVQPGADGVFDRLRVHPERPVLLAVVVVHGVFWSGLLSASAAYMTNMLPERRRAEGIGYWGLSSSRGDGRRAAGRVLDLPPRLVRAVHRGRGPEPDHGHHRVAAAGAMPAARRTTATRRTGRGRLLEWRVLVISFTLFLYSFGYGGITSFTALYADANGVTPKGIYLTTLAIVILVTRPLSGRLGDRFGYRRVLLPCLILISGGLAAWLSAGRAAG